MIEFFEFLNTCSPLRTITYLIFIVAISFVIFAGISDIIKRIMGGEITNHHYYMNGEEVDEEVDDDKSEAAIYDNVS